MRILTTSALCLALLLGPAAYAPAWSADMATIATQVRSNWAQTRDAYLASVKPYAGTSANASLIGQYTTALDKTGVSLEKFLTLKMASPATPAEQMTPAIDQLYKDLLALKAIRSKATGGLATALGNALTQQNQVAQTALANMR